MNILISNDDGVNSDGLKSLVKRLAINNNVLVVAPDGNRSACSHSLTINSTVRLNKIDSGKNFQIYSLSGTPCDCVKFAKLMFPEFKTDFVVAGINKGHNIGSDILYSGTVSIACEASFFGHIAFAFSCFSLKDSDFDGYSVIAENIIKLLLPYSCGGEIWNVNFPEIEAKDIKGIRVTKLGKQLYSDRYVEVSKGEYVLEGEIINHNENDCDCDIEWIKKGYVTVTPILFNKTDYNKIEEVKNKCIKL